MTKIHVRDNIPFGAPQFNSHLGLAQVCLGPNELHQIRSATPNAWEWKATARNTLEELANGDVSQPAHQRPIAKRMQAACELIGDKLPEENPELVIILSAVGRIFDAELEIRRLAPTLDALRVTVLESTTDLLRSGIRGASLRDIEEVATSRT